MWQSFTTIDILFLSEVNSRISKASYWIVEPLNLISAIDQWKLYHDSYNQNQFLMTVKRKCSLPRILAFLLTKTICSWAAAWTRASSSWDCALYTILPFLLQEDGRKILLQRCMVQMFCSRKWSKSQHPISKRRKWDLWMGITVLHIAITVRKRITSEEPLEIASTSSSSASQMIECIRNWTSYNVISERDPTFVSK